MGVVVLHVEWVLQCCMLMVLGCWDMRRQLIPRDRLSIQAYRRAVCILIHGTFVLSMICVDFMPPALILPVVVYSLALGRAGRNVLQSLKIAHHNVFVNRHDFGVLALFIRPLSGAESLRPRNFLTTNLILITN